MHTLLVTFIALRVNFYIYLYFTRMNISGSKTEIDYFMQVKDECPSRLVRRERSRVGSQVVRRHNRLHRITQDGGPTKHQIHAAAAASSARFTSFLVADILGIASGSERRSDQTSHKTDDFSVDRLIQTSSSSDDSCATAACCSTLPTYCSFHQIF